MKLRYTRPALADLASILDYVAARSPAGAAKIHARIAAIIGLLLASPKIGLRTEDPIIRRIAVTPYPYLIFYQIVDDGIIIHAIRHGARDPSSMPGV